MAAKGKSSQTDRRTGRTAACCTGPVTAQQEETSKTEELGTKEGLEVATGTCNRAVQTGDMMGKLTNSESVGQAMKQGHRQRP